MKQKIKYTNGEIGKYKVVDDFLPSPKELISLEKKVRVTINLNQSSIAYFKNVAKSNKSKYQKIIRDILDFYATNAKRAPHFAR